MLIIANKAIFNNSFYWYVSKNYHFIITFSGIKTKNGEFPTQYTHKSGNPSKSKTITTNIVYLTPLTMITITVVRFNVLSYTIHHNTDIKSSAGILCCLYYTKH